MHRGRNGAVLAAFALLVWASAASAALPGQLDATFGGGRVVAPLGPEWGAGGIAVQPDGKVLVTGAPEMSPGFAVARLLPNGSPDPSWGGDGLVTTPLGKFAASLDVAVQPDGKVVAVGEAPGAENEDFAVVRYLENGTPDPNFGENGVVILPVGPLGDTAEAVAIGPGGRIAVTGVSVLPGSVIGAGTAVLEADGSPEAAFAGDGTTVITTESGGDDRGEAIAVQEDGKVVVADATGAGRGDGFTVVRLGLDGKPDPSFGGGDGVVETSLPGEGGVKSGRIADLVIQPDGKIVGGGYGVDYLGVPRGFVSKFALARYTPQGELDPSFGTGGIVTMPVPGSGGAYGTALGLDPKGRLVLGGIYDQNPDPMEEDSAPALARFDPNGSLDSAFGAGGLVLGPLAGGVESETIEGLAIQADGKILAAGAALRAGEPRLPVITRFIAEPEAEVGPANLRPDSNMKRVPRRVLAAKLAGFRGTASDPDGDGVEKVQVALVRVPSGRASARGRAKPKRWRTARGTAKWGYRLRQPLGPGRYVVFSRAIDGRGLAENEFSRRDHNRYAFRVIAGSR